MSEEKQKPGYEGWQWLEKSAEDRENTLFLQEILEETLRKNKFSEETIKGLTLEVDKARLEISQEETSSGAFHTLAGGEPFYRLTFTAEGSLMQPTQAVETLFMLSQVYGSNGGSSMSMSQPMVMTHDFRGDLFHKGLQLREIINMITPYVIKPQNSPKPPAP